MREVYLLNSASQLEKDQKLRCESLKKCVCVYLCAHWGNMGSWVPTAPGNKIMGIMKTKSVTHFGLESTALGFQEMIRCIFKTVPKFTENHLHLSLMAFESIKFLNCALSLADRSALCSLFSKKESAHLLYLPGHMSFQLIRRSFQI